MGGIPTKATPEERMGNVLTKSGDTDISIDEFSPDIGIKSSSSLPDRETYSKPNSTAELLEPRRTTRSKTTAPTYECSRADTEAHDRMAYNLYKTIFEELDSRMCGLRMRNDDMLLDFSNATNVILIEHSGLGIRTVVGAATLRPWPLGDLEIALFAVHRHRKGMGLGRMIFEKCVLPYANDNKFRRLISHANVENGAVDFWSKMSFQKAGGARGSMFITYKHTPAGTAGSVL